MHHNIIEVKMIYNIHRLYSTAFEYIYSKVINIAFILSSDFFLKKSSKYMR